MAATDVATDKYWQQALEFSGDTRLHHLVLQDRLKKIPVLSQDPKKKTSKKQDAEELMVNVRNAINGADLEKLGAANKRGDTPLHLAVARGGLEGNKICVYLCEREVELIGNTKTATAVNDPQQPSTRENCLGETPIFLAALHGNLDAFVLLHAMHPIKEESYRYYTRHDGNTILHVAVLGQHFELAYNIISTYPFLVNSKNNTKETPLHLLARSPTTFRSGYHLEPMDSLLFHLAWVPPLLEKKQVDPRMEQNFESIKATLTPPPPKKSGFFTKCHDLCNQFRKHRAEMNKEKSKSRTTARSIDDSGGANTRLASDKRTSDRPSRLRPALNEIVFFVGFIIEIVLRIFGARFAKMDDIKRKRIRDKWGTRVAAELVEKSTEWNYELRDHDNANRPEKKDEEESSIFVAAKHGVVVIVEEILKKFPFAIHYEGKDKKNIVLLSVENRQYQVFEYLIKHHYSKNAFQRVDNQGNSVSHLAATLAEPAEKSSFKPNIWLLPGATPVAVDSGEDLWWRCTVSPPASLPGGANTNSSFNCPSNILGAALQVQWDIKWFKYIGEKVEGQAWYNNDGKTAQTLFDENHKQLVGDAGKWLTTSATACSVVSALVATVAFATSTSFPGGTDKGLPVLEGKIFFNVFVVASFFGLCFAVISVLSFLAILTSRLLQEDFENYLPTNLIVGLVSLFLSVVFMMVCFCSGHFFMLKSLCNNSYFIRRLVDIMSPFGFYALISFPVVAMFIGPHFSLFIDLLLITFGGKPWRSFARGFF